MNSQSEYRMRIFLLEMSWNEDNLEKLDKIRFNYFENRLKSVESGKSVIVLESKMIDGLLNKGFKTKNGAWIWSDMN